MAKQKKVEDNFKTIVIVLLVLNVLLLSVVAVNSFQDDYEKKGKCKKGDFKGRMLDKKGKHWGKGGFEKGYWIGKSSENRQHDKTKEIDSKKKGRDSEIAKKTVALVDRAVTDYNFDPENAIKSVRTGVYTEGDLYVFGVKGEYNVAHPYRKDLENTKVTERKDANGYYYGRDIVKATEKGRWVDYVFTVPKTDNQAMKSTYCRKVREHILCAGYYHNR